MRRSWLGILALVAGLALAAPDADAKRLGAGRAVGAQRNVTAPVKAAPATPVAAVPAPVAAERPGRWATLAGGLALGAVVGALFAGSPVLGTLAGAAILGLLGFIVFALVRSMRTPRAAPSTLQYAGLGNETVAAPPPSQAAGLEGRIALAGAGRPLLPTGFDVAAFLRAAKESFVRLQMANDRGRLDELRDMTTTGMFEALRAEAGSGMQTDVLTLQADVLEIATEGERHWASVRFSGLVRESPGAEPAGFEEVWNLVKPVNGTTGWLLAGIQPLH
jgi:predicted lipid-binding transport protein (Tim44 family)